jgi:hypothetical protein
MAVLEIHNRPWAVFDPHNREHRNHYAQFIKNGGWGHCPVRFVVPDGSRDLLSMIGSSLVEYYIQREFHKNSRSLKRKRS